MVKNTIAEKFSSYTYGEARTGTGQLINFSCPSGLKENVQQFIRENVENISLPKTGVFSVSHGGHGSYTRYDTKQHEYAGGRSGFIEVLEIHNPPDERCRFVIYEYGSIRGSMFSEWKTLKDARSAFGRYWGAGDNSVNFPKSDGFIRYVNCGALCPWFYATGEEHLIGDYAFPYGIEDDCTFRFGQKFVVFDTDGFPHIKTCMGTRFVVHKKTDYGHQKEDYRIVYWHDGSTWNEGNYEDKQHPPRELREDEMWITEALKQFQDLLAGKNTDFIINFTDRYKFIGKIVANDKKVSSPEGNYHVVVSFKDKDEKKEGKVDDFVPTIEQPDIVTYVVDSFKEKKLLEVTHVEVKKVTAKKNGKKWVGAFFVRKQ